MKFFRPQANRNFLFILFLVTIQCLFLFGCEGDSGNEGEDGERGPQGQEGIRGVEGETGNAGDLGPDGPSGPSGPPGENNLEMLRQYGDIKVAIVSVQIPKDFQPEVTFKISSTQDLALSISDLELEGAVSVNLTLAYIKDQTQYTEYENYLLENVENPDTQESFKQAGYDFNGTLTEEEKGTYLYKFSRPISVSYDATATHTAGLSVSRTFQDRLFTANATFDFVPDGSELPLIKDISESETCNACHIPNIQYHLNMDYDIKLCSLCHTSETFDADTGRSLNFDVLIHNIHMGRNLEGVLGGESYLFIDEQGEEKDFSGISFPQDIRNCESCHTGTQKNVWQETPNREACSGCHNLIDFEDEANPFFHSGGTQLNDESCSFCHPATSTETFTGLQENHGLPLESPDIDPPLARLNFEIIEVRSIGAGQRLQVVFSVTNGEGEPVDLNSLEKLFITAAGPSSNYEWYVTEKNVIDNAAQNGLQYVVSFTDPLPSSIEGTIAIGIYGYRCVPYGETDCFPHFRERGNGAVFYQDVVGGEAQLPDPTVEDIKCLSCHYDINSHSNHEGMFFQVDLCKMCHFQGASDENTRLDGKAESIEMSIMTHKIHRGSMLANSYTLYDYKNTPTDYSLGQYPGQLTLCESCHVENFVSKNETRICTSCHDRDRDYFKTFLGTLYMFEQEKIEDEDTSNNSHRLSVYLNMQFDIQENVHFFNTVYVQPRFDRFSDIRILNEGQLKVDITEHFGFTLEVMTRFDNNPPVDVKKHDLELMNGVFFKF